MRLEAVEKLKTGGDREGKAPAEPHGARTWWGNGLPGGSPQSPPSKRAAATGAGGCPGRRGPTPCQTDVPPHPSPALRAPSPRAGARS